MTRNNVIGIDEVGRGPLAGPVVVAAVLMPANLRFNGEKLRDSKKLTENARQVWMSKIKKHPSIRYAVARVAPATIDRVNISRAANLAALRAFQRLADRYDLNMNKCHVYLDGNLYLGNDSARLPGNTVIKGDEKIPAISLASIVAKVYRDALMVRMALKLPGYGMEAHKGYGTRQHIKALRKLGPSYAHRLTFLDNFRNMNIK